MQKMHASEKIILGNFKDRKLRFLLFSS